MSTIFKQFIHLLIVYFGKNFAQVQPASLSRWMTTCVLLACTRRASHAQLLIALLASRTPHVHERILELAALSFIADDDLDEADREAFMSSIEAQTAFHPAFKTILTLLESDE